MRLEQAVYGSFPFWSRGYGVLARSAGCRPEWLDALRLAAQRYGERPAGIGEHRALFAMRLPRGPWMIVGVFPQGDDDRGRPGALAFHGLFVDPRLYAKAGADPFRFAGGLRGDWTAQEEDAELPPASPTIPPPTPPDPAPDRRAEAIAARIRRGERVAITAAEPIDDLSRAAWVLLPGRVRRRASLATWAFGDENRFDLVATPRLPGMIDEPDVLPPPSPATPRTRRPAALGLGALLLAAAAVVAIFARPRAGTNERPEPRLVAKPGPASSLPLAGPTATTPPPPSEDEDRPVSLEDVRRMTEALAALADRFDADAAGTPVADAAATMRRLADRLRYRGPVLDQADLARLRAQRASPDAANALRWHDLILRFRDDRPLPRDIGREPPRRQLAILAWSFHLDAEPGIREALHRGTPEEVVHAMEDALMVDMPLPQTSLSAAFPALDDYRAFLGVLPRK